jgi:adenylate kinase
MNAGYLISDRKTLSVVSSYLKRDEYQKGYILDGFPRTLGQVKAFENHVNDVVYLNVSDKEALWRLSYRNGECREDETLAAVRKRIDSFHRFTKPVLEFYRKKGILIEVDGEKSIEEIHKEVMSRIKKKGE